VSRNGLPKEVFLDELRRETDPVSSQNVAVTPSVHDGGMTTQLRLIIDDRPADWRLDEETREVGRRGLAEARAALQEAARRAAA
jgi:hypothetical protein